MKALTVLSLFPTAAGTEHAGVEENIGCILADLSSLECSSFSGRLTCTFVLRAGFEARP